MRPGTHKIITVAAASELTPQSVATASAVKFMRAYSERDRDGAAIELVKALGTRDDGAFAFAYALVSIADTAMNESARVLDVEPAQIREVIATMALAHFEKGGSHG